MQWLLRERWGLSSKSSKISPHVDVRKMTLPSWKSNLKVVVLFNFPPYPKENFFEGSQASSACLSGNSKTEMTNNIHDTVESYWEWKTEILGEKPDPVPTFPPHISHKLLFIVCGTFLSPPCSHVIFRHSSQNHSSWSPHSFSSTTFQNFPGIPDLVSEVSKFKHHTLVSSLNLSTFCWWKKSSSCWMLHFPWQSWI